MAAVVASDLQRAFVTAEIIAQRLGVGPVRPEPRLRERDAGEWTGLTRAEIDVQWPGYLLAGRRPPGFELDDAILGRILEALAALHHAHPGGTVLAVAHAGVIRAVERHIGIDDGLVPEPRWPDARGPRALGDGRRPHRARARRAADGASTAVTSELPFSVEVVRSRKRRKTVAGRMVGDVLTVSVPAWMSAAEEAAATEQMVRRFRRRRSSDRVDLAGRASCPGPPVRPTQPGLDPLVRAR